jgi:hypothetical protein
MGDGTTWVAGRTQGPSFCDDALADYDSDGHLVRGNQYRRSREGSVVDRNDEAAEVPMTLHLAAG